MNANEKIKYKVLELFEHYNFEYHFFSSEVI